MPRRGKIVRHEAKPDPVYNSVVVSKFINNLMKKGKKTVAESIFYNAVDLANEKVKKRARRIISSCS